MGNQNVIEANPAELKHEGKAVAPTDPSLDPPVFGGVSFEYWENLTHVI